MTTTPLLMTTKAVTTSGDDPLGGDVCLSVRPAIDEVVCAPIVDHKTVDDLTDGLLTRVLECLPVWHRYAMSRVCQKWRKLIESMMSSQTVLSFGLTDGRSGRFCTDGRHKADKHFDLSDLLDRQQRTGRLRFKCSNRLSTLVRMTYNVESLVFVDCSLDTIALKWIISVLPRLRCLAFDNVDGIQEADWPKLGKPLSTKLLHFRYAGHRMNNWKALSKMVKYFDELEEIHIDGYALKLESVIGSLRPRLRRLSISKCQQLDTKDLKSLSKSRAAMVRELRIDFCGHTDSRAVIDSVYERLRNLSYIEAKNMRKLKIESFVHQIDVRRLTLVFTDSIDLCFLSAPIARSIDTLVVTGRVVPSGVQWMDRLMPNCRQLKLIDCRFDCECDSASAQLATEGDHQYRCLQCFRLSVKHIVRMPKLSLLYINGTEFHR